MRTALAGPSAVSQNERFTTTPKAGLGSASNHPLTDPRAGWAAASAEMAATGDDALLDEPVNTRFDDEEWEWE